MSARVDDAEAERQIRNGTLRGLSLGTDLIMDEGQNVLFRGQADVFGRKRCNHFQSSRRRVFGVRVVTIYYLRSKSIGESRYSAPKSGLDRLLGCD